MWPIDNEVPRKAVDLHKIDAVTTMAAQLELLTKKLDKLT